MKRWRRTRHPQMFESAAPASREVAVHHTESWGRVCALWFPMTGADDQILDYVERVAHPHREPANDSEARIRHNLDTDYRFLTYGSVVRIGHDIEYELTPGGWQRLPHSDHDPKEERP